MTFSPPPVQSPRIPIWVVGAWPRPKSMRRTLRYDGVLASKMAADGAFVDLTPADVQAMTAYIAEHRLPATPFDIVLEGNTPGDDHTQAVSTVQPFAEAGATWWLEGVWSVAGGVDGMRTRVMQGPPSAG